MIPPSMVFTSLDGPSYSLFRYFFERKFYQPIVSHSRGVWTLPMWSHARKTALGYTVHVSVGRIKESLR